jgi:hypothetical protein
MFRQRKPIRDGPGMNNSLTPTIGYRDISAAMQHPWRNREIRFKMYVQFHPLSQDHRHSLRTVQAPEPQTKQ